MNPITLSIIIVVTILALTYMITKNHYVSTLSKAMKKKDYSTVISITQKSICRKLLGEFNCDLFLIRAYYLMNDIDRLKATALKMLHNEYRSDQTKQFLELYYHIFLNRNDLEMAEQFLNQIVQMDDSSFVKYNQYAYNVIQEKQDDLIEVMEAEINAKLYTGNPLGIIVYLIALQYLYKKDYENAHRYFEECLVCFHPNALYIDLAKSQIKKIESLHK